jgi:regulator of nonsense transcripts 1
MEGAFTHVGNHLLSDSAATIKAGGDDLSTIDPDEALLYGKFGASSTGRRRADDDDNQTEAYDDDDNDSLTSVPVGGMQDLNINAQEEERQLPAHACAYVYLLGHHSQDYGSRRSEDYLYTTPGLVRYTLVYG